MTASFEYLRSAPAALARGLILTAALMLAACSADTTIWTPAAAPKANKLTLAHLTHDVAFAPSEIEPGEEGLKGLDAFLRRHDVGYGDRVYVIASGRNPGAVANRRAEAIARNLARNGIGANVLADAEWAGAPDAADAVRVLVHRFVVVAPRCPDWSKPSDTDYGNTQASNFGCANAVNFGMMLADPRDLVEGSEPGPASGETAAAAVRRYYEGKVMPLDKSATDTSKSGAGGK